jgi:predicted nucleic acid-binding protein
MNVVDSSGWLEYLADGPNAQFFATAVETTDDLVVPTISIYEVFKRLLVQRGEDEALEAAVAMQQARVEPLSTMLGLEAARLSAELGLPMADSIMLATARQHEAVLWTQDSDFEGLSGVKYVAARGKRRQT